MLIGEVVTQWTRISHAALNRAAPYLAVQAKAQELHMYWQGLRRPKKNIYISCSDRKRTLNLYGATTPMLYLSLIYDSFCLFRPECSGSFFTMKILNKVHQHPMIRRTRLCITSLFGRHRRYQVSPSSCSSACASK